ncbi:MAG TPA: nucleotidyltransferase family protein [Acidimicrobiales bacterium]|nr:nucleotidyltransferase family protein [Acidimicrobiales bacterium]
MSATATEAGEVLAAVAAYGLPGAGLELPRRPLDDRDWRRLMVDVGRQRISGLLVQAIDHGDFAASAEQADAAEAAHTAAMHVVLRLERLLVDVAGRLEEAGIDCRALKGSAAAHLDYPNPALRCFGDIDVLVRSDDYDAAVGLLRDAGSTARYDEPRPGFGRRFGKGAELVTPEGLEIDLHRTFVSGPFGLSVVLDDLFASGTPFEVGGRRLLALTSEQRFLHACFHAALGARPARLQPLRDIAQLALFGRLDVDRVFGLTAAWKVPAVLAAGVRLAWERFAIGDVTPLSAWAHGFEPDARERASLAAYMDTGFASYPAQAAAALRAIPGWVDRAAYLRAMAMPDRSYLQARDGGYLRRLARGARHLARRPGTR